jgi:hypothetical protein
VSTRRPKKNQSESTYATHLRETMEAGLNINEIVIVTIKVDTQTKPLGEWLTRKETEKYANISRSRFFELIKSGDFTARKNGKYTEIERASIDRWKQKTTSPPHRVAPPEA